jgi:hypothetical protein
MHSGSLGLQVTRAFRLILRGASVLLVLVALSGVANGMGYNFNDNDKNGRKDGDATSGVPEIDPGSIASAMALLGGGALLLTTRRRRS